MSWEDDLDKMIGTFFQYERWNGKGDFLRAYAKWKKTLTLKTIAFLYFTYWTSEPKLKEVNELEKCFKKPLRVREGEEK